MFFEDLLSSSSVTRQSIYRVGVAPEVQVVHRETVVGLENESGLDESFQIPGSEVQIPMGRTLVVN